MKRLYRIYKASDWGRTSPHPDAKGIGGREWRIELDDSELYEFMLEVGGIVLKEGEIIIYDWYIE